MPQIHFVAQIEHLLPFSTPLLYIYHTAWVMTMRDSWLFQNQDFCFLYPLSQVVKKLLRGQKRYSGAAAALTSITIKADRCFCNVRAFCSIVKFSVCRQIKSVTNQRQPNQKYFLAPEVRCIEADVTQHIHFALHTNTSPQYHPVITYF